MSVFSLLGFGKAEVRVTRQTPAKLSLQLRLPAKLLISYPISIWFGGSYSIKRSALKLFSFCGGGGWGDCEGWVIRSGWRGAMRWDKPEDRLGLWSGFFFFFLLEIRSGISSQCDSVAQIVVLWSSSISVTKLMLFLSCLCLLSFCWNKKASFWLFSVVLCSLSLLVVFVAFAIVL